MGRDAGGDAAFTELASASRARLRSTAYLLCGDWDRASDHVEEGLIRAYLAWPRLRRQGGELADARKAVASAFLDASRKRSSTEPPASAHPDQASSEDVASAVAGRTALLAALAGLPARQRACVVLRYFEELDVRETATSLGCSEGTVKSQTARALDSLRAMLEDASRDELVVAPERSQPWVDDLAELMRESVATPPPDHLDLDAVVRAGRRRVRRRRAVVAGAIAVLVAGVTAGTVWVAPNGSEHAGPADTPPSPDAPTLRLADAERAVEGRDFTVLASYTNENLDQGDGLYFAGFTEDGLVLFRDGRKPYLRIALMDPSTGEKDWLPDLDVQGQTWPVELGRARLVLLGIHDASDGRLVAHVFDRADREWSEVGWSELPAVNQLSAVMGPADRLYALVPATQGTPPAGGWPTGPDGEADDADAQGDSYHVWSVSLDDDSEVRDEGLTVGSLAFTDTSMVWTDSTNGDAGLVHMRDLSTGEEHSFDPHAGDRCNLLSFGATDDRVVMGQYCGTYGGVRDDRVQILTTDGEQVATLQDDFLEGGLAGSRGTDAVVTVTARHEGRAGTYVYDLADDRFLRVSDAVSPWAVGAGPMSRGTFVWGTPTKDGQGTTHWLGQLLR